MRRPKLTAKPLYSIPWDYSLYISYAPWWKEREKQNSLRSLGRVGASVGVIGWLMLSVRREPNKESQSVQTQTSTWTRISRESTSDRFCPITSTRVWVVPRADFAGLTKRTCPLGYIFSCLLWPGKQEEQTAVSIVFFYKKKGKYTASSRGACLSDLSVTCLRPDLSPTCLRRKYRQHFRRARKKSKTKRNSLCLLRVHTCSIDINSWYYMWGGASHRRYQRSLAKT